MKQIERSQLRGIKFLLNKEDIKAIADKVGRSESAVNAVFWTRPHEDTEIEILRTAQEKVSSVTGIISKYLFNIEPLNISVEEYRRLKSLRNWKLGEGYWLQMDACLQAAHIKFKDAFEALEWIKIEFSQLLNHKYYLLEFLVRSFSINEYNAAREIIRYYKKRRNND